MRILIFIFTLLASSASFSMDDSKTFVSEVLEIEQAEYNNMDHTILNLVWLSKYVDKNNKFVFPTEREGLEVVPYIKGWLEHGYTIAFWFDKTTSLPQQIDNTVNLFQEIANELNISENKLQLTDIWDLDSVRKKTELFSNKTGSVPVYFRADIIRLMISQFQLQQQKGLKYSIYSDLDVTPISFGELFTKENSDKLDKIGMVVSRGGFNCNMENSFHIAQNHWATVEALELTIEANIARFFQKSSQEQEKSGQQVYDTYPPMFRYLYHLRGYGLLSGENVTDNEKIDHNQAIALFCCGNPRVGYPDNFASKFEWMKTDPEIFVKLIKEDLVEDELDRLNSNKVRLSKFSSSDIVEASDHYSEILKLKSDLKIIKKDLDLLDDKDELSEIELERFKQLEVDKKIIADRIKLLKNSIEWNLLWALESIQKSEEAIIEYRNSTNIFKFPYMWIPKVTVKRPPAKGSGYN